MGNLKFSEVDCKHWYLTDVSIRREQFFETDKSHIIYIKDIAWIILLVYANETGDV